MEGQLNLKNEQPGESFSIVDEETSFRIKQKLIDLAKPKNNS